MKNPRFPTALMAALTIALSTTAAAAADRQSFTNTLGMRMIPIEPGAFTMGETNETSPDVFKQPKYLTRGDWDEHPAREIEITKPFFIAEVEVTIG